CGRYLINLLQRFGSIEWALLNISPIYHKFESVTTSPVAHQFPGGAGGNISGPKPTVKSKRRLLALKLDMKMWRIMISEIHSVDDPEKRRDDGHGCFLADSGIQAYRS